MNGAFRAEFLHVFGGLAATLLLASGVGAVLQWRYSGVIAPAVLANLNSRIRAWWVMITLVGACLWAGPLALTAVFAIASALALREFLQVVLDDRLTKPATLACFGILLPAQYVLIALRTESLLPESVSLFIWVPLAAAIVLPALVLLAPGRRRGLIQAFAQWCGVLLCVGCIAHVPALLVLDIPGYGQRNALLVVFFLIVVQASDVLQYICGKLTGRHPIAPRLSPAKTTEGFVGGVLLATGLGGALSYITPFSSLAALAMALVITLTGFAGGLALSALKRVRGVKDWGDLIPGHGGVLDRLDSVWLSAPVFYHLTRWLYT